MTSSSVDRACHICGNQVGHREFTCREKMFGLGDPFPYFQCGQCQCLQLATTPDDWNRFYPPAYYSFNQSPAPMKGYNAWRHRQRDIRMLTGKGGWLGRLFSKARAPEPALASIRRAAVTPQTRILDVGCGRGHLLSVLWRAGFRNLGGLDPFLPADVEITPGLTVRRSALEDLKEQFDLIMMHHVFEHLPDPRATLRACHDRLHPRGQVIVRIPCVDSDSWERYRENWVNLDCPRHVHLLSRRSVELLADQTGFTIKDWYCDADGFQFWGSELYTRGLTLYDAQGQSTPLNDHFSREELDRFEQEAARLNSINRGDQVAV